MSQRRWLFWLAISSTSRNPRAAVLRRELRCEYILHDGVKVNSMRNVIRVFLALAFLAAVAAMGMVFFFPGAFRPEVWAVGAAALAVLPAVFATWSTQRMLELQEDANAPLPYPSFDARSRYQVLQLRIQNLGKGIAKNVYLEWDGKAVEAAEGGPAKYLTKECPVPILLPDKDESFFVDVARRFAEKHGHSNYAGIVHFQDVAGKSRSHRFVLATSHLEESLLADDEALKTHFEIQKLPSELAKITAAIERLVK